jgi:molybdopterin-guanine dinucleotide biosynthesis protein A
MGEPKEGVILWDGRPMIEHVIGPVAAVCRQVASVGACRGFHPSSERNLVRIADRHPGAGPLAGIETLLASGLDSGYLVVACDQPLLTPRLLRSLLVDADLARPHVFGGTTEGDFNPFPGYFPSTWLPQVRAVLRGEQRAVRTLLSHSRVVWVPVPRGLRGALRSVNSPADLATVRCPPVRAPACR